MSCVVLVRDDSRLGAYPADKADKVDRLSVPRSFPQSLSLTSSSSSLLLSPSRTPSFRRSVNLPRRQTERPTRRSTISAVLALGRRASLSRFLSEQREMRATVRMAIIIACFCGMWVGFFVLYVVSGWCPSTTCPLPCSSVYHRELRSLYPVLWSCRGHLAGHSIRSLDHVSSVPTTCPVPRSPYTRHCSRPTCSMVTVFCLSVLPEWVPKFPGFKSH